MTEVGAGVDECVNCGTSPADKTCETCEAPLCVKCYEHEDNTDGMCEACVEDGEDDKDA